MIEGCEVYAENIESIVYEDTKPVAVYSICTDKRRSILINGLLVMTWEPIEWYATVEKRSIVWADNS